MLKVDRIVTSHNADDIAETVLMNVLRSNVTRLSCCMAITTGTEGAIPRSKPFKYAYEKEIVMCAYLKSWTTFPLSVCTHPMHIEAMLELFPKILKQSDQAASSISYTLVTALLLNPTPKCQFKGCVGGVDTLPARNSARHAFY